MKVRGFQVAPAELEGHLLNNSFVSDVCVVGVPDEYSGEIPFAFITPSDEARERIKRGEEKLVKAQIAKVRICAELSERKSERLFLTRLVAVFLVCCGREGSVQALGWWDCVHRRYSKESEWEIVKEIAEGQGQRGPAEDPGGEQHHQGPALIPASLLLLHTPLLYLSSTCTYPIM